MKMLNVHTLVPEIPLLEIYSKDIFTHTQICMNISIVALFRRRKIGNCKSPSLREGTTPINVSKTHLIS